MAGPGARHTDPEAPTAVLAAVAASLREVADALAGHHAPPGLEGLDAARAAFTARRLHAVRVLGPGEETVRRAETAVAVAQIARGAAHRRAGDPGRPGTRAARSRRR